MCVNYAPVQRQVLRDIFCVELPADEWRSDAWPDFLAWHPAGVSVRR